MRGAVETILSPSPGGVREDLNPAMLPDGALLASANWLTRRGVGRPRPGYTLLISTDGNRVLGIGVRGTKDQSGNVIVSTTTKTYTYDGMTTTDSTGSGWVTSLAGDHVRIVTFSQSGTDYAMLINQKNALREWSGSGNFAATAGSPPNGNDLCVAGNRLVVAHPAGLPYRVRWSGFKDRTSWPSTSFVDLTDTPGAVIAVRPFGPNTFGVYKDDAVYAATLQAAVEPFQFQFIARVPGPLSPAALVDALGVHYWIGEDYALYKFDGSAPKLVSTGLAKTIATNIVFTDRVQMFGAPWFSQDEREVWFFYPTPSGKFNGVSYNIQTEALNHHTFADTMTAAMDWRMLSANTIDGLDSVSSTIDGLTAYSPTIDGLDGSGGVTRSLLLGSSVGSVFNFGQSPTDNGTNISWNFTHGWIAPGKLVARTYLDAVTTYWRNTTTSITVTVGVTVTDKLGETDTETTREFVTSADEQHTLTFPNKEGKLIKVRQAGVGYQSTLEYRGALVTGWNKGRV